VHQFGNKKVILDYFICTCFPVLQSAVHDSFVLTFAINELLIETDLETVPPFTYLYL